MASTLWDDDERSARANLSYLRDKALLLTGVSESDGTSTFRLHDLVHFLARRLLSAPARVEKSDIMPGLGLPLSNAHSLLLRRYRGRTLQGLWHTLADDGYIHANLSWHLEQAGEESQIHDLLREETAERRNGWYIARERLGELAGYVADLSRARRIALKNSKSSPCSTGLQYRYLLMLTSLNSLAEMIPLGLLVCWWEGA